MRKNLGRSDAKSERNEGWRGNRHRRREFVFFMCVLKGVVAFECAIFFKKKFLYFKKLGVAGLVSFGITFNTRTGHHERTLFGKNYK